MAGRGWVSIHRKIVDSEIFLDPRKLKLWLMILLTANHGDSKFQFNGNSVELKEGQLMTGRNQLASDYNHGMKTKQQVTSKTIWSWMKYFEEQNMITIESNSRYSVVTITNYRRYQDKPDAQQSGGDGGQSNE